uniref:DDE-1 domain-containing protein n=1 Tax=Clastoptera arizonana TaxID=38151 RepID=A0A1B6C052_9HEMI
MTSVVQPMDQGVIKNLKHFYRRHLVQTLLTDSLEKNTFSKIDILQAARMCHSAWGQVSQTTIANCFKKAGFAKNSDQNPSEVLEEDAPSTPDGWEATAFEEYVNVDEQVAVCGELSDQDILAEVKNNDLSDLEEEEGEEEEVLIPTTAEALQQLSVFLRYIEGQTNVSETVFQSLNVLESFVNFKKINSAKQSHFSKYF